MTEMLDAIRSLGDQLEWADRMDIPQVERTAEILIAGMGGSGIAGDFASALATTGPARVTGHKTYGPLPGWAHRTRPLVIAVSYSGNTEETLDVAGEAAAADLDVIAITTGGSLGQMATANGWPMIEVPAGQLPRASVGYLFGAVARVLESCGAIQDAAENLNDAAQVAREATSEGSGTWEKAARLASALSGRIPIVYGGGPISGAAAQRWKTQINENSKMPSWYSVLPELDHNEIAGWESLPELTQSVLGIIGLRDPDDPPRVGARHTFSKELTEFAVPWVGEVHSTGKTPMGRLFSLVAAGDLVSWMLARDADVDPIPVAIIEDLKKLLSKGNQ